MDFPKTIYVGSLKKVMNDVNKSLTQVMNMVYEFDNYKATNKCNSCDILHEFWSCPELKEVKKKVTNIELKELDK